MHALLLTTEDIFQHHLEAFLNADIGEIMKDYSQESEVWTPDGPLVGTEAISSFYSYVFNLLPKGGTQFGIKHKIIKGDKVYIVWNAESAMISIPIGTDSFEMRDGKIMWQTLAAHIIPKSS